MISNPVEEEEEKVMGFGTSCKHGFHLTCKTPLANEAEVIAFFQSLFDIKKMVFVKDNSSRQSLIKEVILALATHNNEEMLQDGVFHIYDTKLVCKQISAEELEGLIRKNRLKIYIGNIPFGVDNVKLWKHFTKYGKLEYTYIIKKPDRNAKGFGFIMYEERESVEKAINGKNYINGQKLTCKIFMNKNQLMRSDKQKLDKKNKEEVYYCDPRSYPNSQHLLHHEQYEAYGAVGAKSGGAFQQPHHQYEGEAAGSQASEENGYHPYYYACSSQDEHYPSIPQAAYHHHQFLGPPLPSTSFELFKGSSMNNLRSSFLRFRSGGHVCHSAQGTHLDSDRLNK